MAKFIGDAVVALFGAPIAHEDDPERAVRAAFAVTKAIEKLNASDDWLNLNIRTGINTGDAIVVVGANPGEEIGEAAGDVMNTAARIQGCAPINGIVVGELTHEATKHAIEYEEAEPVEAKGKRSPFASGWPRRRRRCRRAARAARAARRSRRRAGEAARAVGGSPAPAAAGHGDVVGAPGIGKSRLLEEVGSHVDNAA